LDDLPDRWLDRAICSHKTQRADKPMTVASSARSMRGTPEYQRHDAAHDQMLATSNTVIRGMTE
jgi:hypothetical protein